MPAAIIVLHETRVKDSPEPELAANSAINAKNIKEPEPAPLTGYLDKLKSDSQVQEVKLSDGIKEAIDKYEVKYTDNWFRIKVNFHS